MTTPLPPTDPSSGDDKLPGEAELAALYRQLPQSEPAPALDTAVLRAAAQALEGTEEQPRIERRKGPREPGDWVHPRPITGNDLSQLRSIESVGRRPRRRTPSWLIALGSAASLVLVAGLAWHMRATPTAGPLQASSVAPSGPAAAAPPQAKQLTATTGSESAGLERRRETIEAQPSPPAHNAIVAGMPSASAKPVVTPPVVNAPRSGGYAAASSAKADAAQRTLAAPAMRPVPPPPPVEEMSAAPAPALAPPAPPSPTAAANDSADAAATAADSPAQELSRIRQLFAQGHDDEARRRLRDFRREHPQWPLPPALQAQLPKP